MMVSVFCPWMSIRLSFCSKMSDSTYDVLKALLYKIRLCVEEYSQPRYIRVIPVALVKIHGV